MKWQGRHDFVEVGSDGEYELEPRRAGGGVATDEASDGIPRVRAMILRFTQPVYKQHCALTR